MECFTKEGTDADQEVEDEWMETLLFTGGNRSLE